jgi:hypothetical protein
MGPNIFAPRRPEFVRRYDGAMRKLFFEIFRPQLFSGIENNFASGRALFVALNSRGLYFRLSNFARWKQTEASLAMTHATRDQGGSFMNPVAVLVTQ